VTSPIKTVTIKEAKGAAKKALFLGDGVEDAVKDGMQLLTNVKGKGKEDGCLAPEPNPIISTQAMQVHVAEDGGRSNVDDVEKMQMGRGGCQRRRRGAHIKGECRLMLPTWRTVLKLG
jgi:hypothetical protein